VSFTDEVAYCHRCHWTANKTTLAREHGQHVPAETKEHKLAREKADRFNKAWIEAKYKKVSTEYRRAGRLAEIAKKVLRKYPECEPAWDALKRFYDSQARLAGTLDALAFEKLSVWYEGQVTAVDLFQMWSRTHARK
jgi:hypothetical protein